ncbi:hypothetical protein [Planomonospora venezuelensis]
MREKVVSDSPYIKLSGEEKYRVGNNDEAVSETLAFTKGVQATATWQYKGSADLSFGKVIELGGEVGYQDTEALNDSFTRTVTVTTAKGQFKFAQQYALMQVRNVYRQWVTPSGYLCGNTLIATAAFPDSSGVCVWDADKDPHSVCRHWQFTYGGGGGPAPGGTAPPQPPAPQPVTSVHGLADGTVLATTDTKRIYKMVGGAPVWQATCADDICRPQSRPTTQAVINAGPATPRNGSTAVDQRGRIYLFVGGAPLWQDTCAAPVTCGSPVKVSDWSIDAREHMNQRPADGHLVQAKAGSVDLPVAVTVGGALIPFADPQEVIDSGYGGDWASRVVAISAHSYQLLGFDPANNTLIQGASGGVSTPVAMVVGNAIIPFASEQEVIDVGYGANWRSLVRGVPARAFNARSRVPADMTLVQGTGGGVSTPVAQVVGGARINFADPQEVIDAGYGNDWRSKVRAIPIRAFNELRPDIPDDGTLVQGPGTAVARIVGGARVEFANPQEVVDAGYGNDWGRIVRAIPARAFKALPTKIADGTRLRKAGSSSQGGIIGGAKIPFHSMAELEAAGYGPRPTQVVPARVWDALPTQIGDGTRIKDADSSSQAAIVGGAKIAFNSMDELTQAGYADKPMQIVPGRVWDALPTQIGDGTRIKDADSSSQAAIVGGAKIAFNSMDELTQAGYADKPMQIVPGRVWDALPTQIGDGTRIKDADSSSQAAIVGGAKIPFISMDELTQAGYADKPMQIVPGRVWDALPTQIGDGTRIKDADSSSQAAIVGGAKIPFISMDELTQAGYADKPMQIVPGRVWDALPTQIGDGTRIAKAGATSEAAIVGGAKVEFHTMDELIASGYKDEPRQVIPARVWDGLTKQIADGTRIAKAGATSEAAVVGKARVDFHTMAELQAAGYGGKLRQVIPARVWDGLTTDIADGTYVKSPDSAAVWLINGGRRTPASRSSGVQVIPTRVLDAIPLA